MVGSTNGIETPKKIVIKFIKSNIRPTDLIIKSHERDA
jgi:hypothetical protein